MAAMSHLRLLRLYTSYLPLSRIDPDLRYVEYSDKFVELSDSLPTEGAQEHLRIARYSVSI